MAPTRRRDSGSHSSDGDGSEQDEERPPKVRRISDGGAAAGSSSGSSSTGHDEEGENMAMGDAPPQAAAASAVVPKGKGKRRATNHDDDNDNAEEEEEEEEQEEEVEGENDGREQRPAAGVVGHEANGGAGVTNSATAVGDESVEVPPPETSSERDERTKKEKDKQSKKARKSEAGVVLKVYAENFMCHRKLSVPFCRHINFINGRNGSGKSAIIAALQICLGARANLTHRAKKLTDLIRHGWKGDAVLEVTLLNDISGFKFEEYGESITIRRTIKQPSGGSIALLGHDRQIKSRDKSELSEMMDMLSIQVNNPCAVLDQENSKKFLQGDDRDKYAFFMKATDLDRIEAHIKEASCQVSHMHRGHHKALDQNARLQGVVDELRVELKQYQDLDKLEEQIIILKERVAWAHVERAEEHVGRLGQSLEEKNLEIKTLNERLAGFEQAIAALAERKEEVKARFDAAVAETERLRDEAVRKRNEFKEAQEPLLSLRCRRGTLESEKRQKTEEKDKFSEQLKSARESAKRSASDEREKSLHHEIQRTEESLANAVRMREQRGGEEKIFGLSQAVNQAKDGADKAKENFQHANQELLARKSQLSNLQTGAFNPLTALGDYMPALVRKVQQEARQFQSPPVGPIGASIELKEEHKGFRVCIEGHLNKNLSNFVVPSQRDKTKLMAVFRAFRGSYRNNKNFPLPTIIVQAPQARYRPPQNPRGFLQIMQAITVDNDQVFNSLVDQSSIEKICLFRSKEEAEPKCLIGTSGRYQRMPHGMFEAYYPSRQGQSCSRFTVSDGNLQTRMNTVNPNRHRRVLGVDEGTQKEELQAQVSQAEAATTQARAAADAEARRAKDAETAFEEEEKERKGLDEQASMLEREKSKLSTQLLALRAERNDSSDPTAELEKDLEVAREAEEEVDAELDTVVEEVNQTIAAIEPFKRAWVDAKQSHKDSSAACKSIQDELEVEGQGETRQQVKIQRAKAALDQANEEVEKLSVLKQEAEADCRAAIQKAETCVKNFRSSRGLGWDGERVRAGGTVEALGRKVETKEARLQSERQKKNLHKKTKREVIEQLEQALTTRNEKARQADQLATNMKLLSGERNKRDLLWKDLRKHVARRTCVLFDIFLQEKGANGNVEFMDDERTLILTYQKDGGDDSSQCTDVRQLSGGERSFATLALLLALGSCHDCPFRVMDEFDVFMDAMSRDIAIKQVLEFAERDCTRQFIFITPQDLSSVTPSDTCKIIKMRPPRKGDHNQTTLEEAFGAGTSTS